ncbi:SRPBCC family protein [Cystobacter fuscus]|uniref:SRPBCC family protein n=1 Tax=Cystobacter fuscus TaxID=43 RepID=UPI002B2CEB7A|nr:SRPBCC family protein [Cystobacter fuscus]
MVVNEQATKIAASAERVWKLFSTPDGQRIAGKGYVSSMEFEGQGLGMVRTMRTEGHLGVAYVKERCDHYDDANMEMMYQIIDTGGLVPFADYRGFAKVIRAGPEACVLMLRSTFIPVDMPEADAKKISEKNFELFFQNVKAAVAAGEV